MSIPFWMHGALVKGVGHSTTCTIFLLSQFWLTSSWMILSNSALQKGQPGTVLNWESFWTYFLSVELPAKEMINLSDLSASKMCLQLRRKRTRFESRPETGTIKLMSSSVDRTKRISRLSFILTYVKSLDFSNFRHTLRSLQIREFFSYLTQIAETGKWGNSQKTVIELERKRNETFEIRTQIRLEVPVFDLINFQKRIVKKWRVPLFEANTVLGLWRFPGLCVNKVPCRTERLSSIVLCLYAFLAWFPSM